MEIWESMDVESIVQLVQVLVNLGISLISSTVSLVVFFLGAWGLFTIAKRRNLPRPWLAWIPVGNSWILGSIADQYQERVNGKKTIKRKWILGLDIGLRAMSVAFVAMACVFLVVAVLAAFFALSSEIMAVFAVIFLVVYFSVVLVAFAASIGYSVFLYICYYDLFRSCKPNLAVLFLVLSILFSRWVNIAVLIFRNSDEGMPAEQYLPEEL